MTSMYLKKSLVKFLLNSLFTVWHELCVTYSLGPKPYVTVISEKLILRKPLVPTRASKGGGAHTDHPCVEKPASNAKIFCTLPCIGRVTNPHFYNRT